MKVFSFDFCFVLFNIPHLRSFSRSSITLRFYGHSIPSSSIITYHPKSYLFQSDPIQCTALHCTAFNNKRKFKSIKKTILFLKRFQFHKMSPFIQYDYIFHSFLWNDTHTKRDEEDFSSNCWNLKTKTLPVYANRYPNNIVLCCMDLMLINIFHLMIFGANKCANDYLPCHLSLNPNLLIKKVFLIVGKLSFFFSNDDKK